MSGGNGFAYIFLKYYKIQIQIFFLLKSYFHSFIFFSRYVRKVNYIISSNVWWKQCMSVCSKKSKRAQKKNNEIFRILFCNSDLRNVNFECIKSRHNWKLDPECHLMVTPNYLEKKKSFPQSAKKSLKKCVLKTWF